MSNLLTYLQQVQKLEMDRYVCEQAEANYQENLENHDTKIQEISKKYNDNITYLKNQPNSLTKEKEDKINKLYDEPIPEAFSESDIGKAFVLLIVMFMISAVIVLGLLKINTMPLAPIVSFIIASIITTIIEVCIYKSKSKKIKALETHRNTLIRDIETQYDKKIKEAQYSLRSKIKTLETELDEKLNQLHQLMEKEEQNIAQTNATINQINAALNTAYSVGIIPKKYRSLVPVTMFCEYIENGRCVALSGHEGAINLYENELRQNLIISKLDSIRSDISGLADNQFRLYQSLNSANTQIANLTSSYNAQNALISHNASVAQHQNEMLLSIERDKLDAIKRIEPLLGG